MRKILEKSWTYTLYQDEEDYFLEAVCGSVGIFELAIRLNDEEKKLFSEQGEAFISSLAQKISDSPQAFQDRKVDLR